MALACALGSQELGQSVQSCTVLVVGAGGIGCELVKNLVLTGFGDIHLIDLDTIEVSNLNRQFLFQKKHVGRSKAEVARDSALSFNPSVKITAYHDSIFNSSYNVDFFKQFTLVMNALDNKAARNHVNRLCLAADVPLVESGTAGYLGQVTVIKKGLSECYECQPKPATKTYPGCTIRNTPSEPVHCIVWSKHLFNQLFGEPDADQDVSPDTADPELLDGSTAENSSNSDSKQQQEERKLSTRLWAESIAYDPAQLFAKLFYDDVLYLLSMDKLWVKRSPPTPLRLDHLPEGSGATGGVVEGEGLLDQRLWSVKECVQVFMQSTLDLSRRYKEEGELVWDKDDKVGMDFVTATANLRCYVFGIQMKSRFDIKSMAGNIIPAIATTNAVIAGVIVMEALRILDGRIKQCKTTYLPRKPNPHKRLLVACQLAPPNPKCYVCASKPEVSLKLNVGTVTVKTLRDSILKETFGMVAPDVEIEDGKGTILLSSEEGETEDNLPLSLRHFGVVGGSRLKADDFLQNYQLVLTVQHSCDPLPDGVEFEVTGEMPQVEEAAEAEKAPAVSGVKRRLTNSDLEDGIDREESQPKRTKRSVEEEEEDGIVMAVD